MRLLVAACLCALSTLASATKFAPVTIDELYSVSEFVAVVQIVDGSVLFNGAKECGAKYHARVIELIKGASTSKSIDLGHSPGFEIGTHYLVFLSSTTRQYAPMLSTNSEAVRIALERDRDCAKIWPKLNLLRGFSASWYEEKWKESRSVHFNPTMVDIPANGYRGANKAHGYPIFNGQVHVPLDHVVTYLRKLSN